MLRRTQKWLLLNVSGESPSFRAKPGIRNLLVDVAHSPYKEQFKDYWSTPVPWQDREYGEKPKLGDPIPTRRAATTIIVGKNRHADPDKVASGEDNDYKVLMHFREAKGRFVKDQFTFPGAPLNNEDRNMESWMPVLRRRGLVTSYDDIQERLAAFRALLIMANILVIPKEGGGIAEVEGPPGPKKWHVMVAQHPRYLRDLVDVLELPLETVFSQFLPFRNLITPTTETFRFENKSFIVPFPKIPCVEFTMSNVGEQLVWVSPQEALARFNAGIMNMPTPNAILLSEMNNQYPTFDEITKHMTAKSEAISILPELVHHQQGDQKVATVLVPGDMHHTLTTPEDRERQYVRRFVYEKDYPFGVRAVFEERPASAEEAKEELHVAPPLLLEEANEMDMVYADVPYLKRNVNPAQQGNTAYVTPDITLKDGPENAEGLITRRQEYTGLEDFGGEDDAMADMVSTKANGSKPTPVDLLRSRRNAPGPGY